MGSPRQPDQGDPNSQAAGGFDPNKSAGSATTGGSADIWGVGDKGSASVLRGVTEPQDTSGLGTGRMSAANAYANIGGAPSNATRDKAGNITGINPGYGVPQYSSVNDMMSELATLYSTDRAAYIALQQKLYKAGFYGSTPAQSIGIGVYNDQTINAYRNAVLNAAQLNQAGNPVTFNELLAQENPAVAARDKAAGQKAIQPGYMAQYSDPQTVAAIAQSAAQQTLGRNLSTAEVGQFTKAFHQQEQQWNSNRKAAALTAAKGKDVTVQDQPSAQAAAAQFTEQGSRGTEAQGNRMADYVGVLERMLGGQ